MSDQTAPCHPAQRLDALAASALTAAPDPLLDDLRAALDAADWTPQDHLTIGSDGGLVVECLCDCGTITAVTGRVVQHSLPTAALAAAATNALPALIERLTTAEAKLPRFSQREFSQAARDRDEARRSAAELALDLEQSALLIASLSNTVRQVAAAVGVASFTNSSEILPALREVLDRSGRRAGHIAEVRALATKWATERDGFAEIINQQASDGREILAILDRDEDAQRQDHTHE